jgi:hypothetical protein
LFRGGEKKKVKTALLSITYLKDKEPKMLRKNTINAIENPAMLLFICIGESLYISYPTQEWNSRMYIADLPNIVKIVQIPFHFERSQDMQITR